MFNLILLSFTWIFRFLWLIIIIIRLFIILVLLPADRGGEDARFFRKVQSGPGNVTAIGVNVHDEEDAPIKKVSFYILVFDVCANIGHTNCLNLYLNPLWGSSIRTYFSFSSSAWAWHSICILFRLKE